MTRPDGFTMVPNTLLEGLIRAELSVGEYKILLAVIRATYGFHKTSAELSYGLLAERCSLHKTTAYRAVKALVKRGFLFQEAPAQSRIRPLLLNEEHICRLADSSTANGGVCTGAYSGVSRGATHINKYYKESNIKKSKKGFGAYDKSLVYKMLNEED